MGIPDSISDRIRDSFAEDFLLPGSTRQKVTAIFDPSQLPIPVDASGASVSNRSKILNATDYEKAFTWANFGTKNERITQIAHTAPTTLPGVTILETFSYTLVSGSYRLDSIVWSEI